MTLSIRSLHSSPRQRHASFGLTLYRTKPSEKDEKDWFSNALKKGTDGNLIMLVALVQSLMVGWCDVESVAPNTPADHRGSLGVCVRKEFRKRGIGKELVKAALEKCKGRFESLELEVFANNRAAIRLYQGFGFEVYGRRERSIKRGTRYFEEELMRRNF
jgi:ribosomal protein S18 acetylase RimI-like enzyme